MMAPDEVAVRFDAFSKPLIGNKVKLVIALFCDSGVLQSHSSVDRLQ